MNKTKSVAKKKDLKSTELKGLCVNCANRKDCRIRDVNHVVNHCEEYL